MMPEIYLADALGAAGKPMMRVHTAGSVGGSTALVAAHLVQAGLHERVLTVAFEKQSESNAMWALTTEDSVLAAGRRGRRRLLRADTSASTSRGRVRPNDIGTMVAVKDRLNALRNPYAHLHMEGITQRR